MTTAELELELKALPTSKKARLADFLLACLDQEEPADVEPAWAEECQTRMAAFERGEVQALDGEKVLQELRQRYHA